MGCCLLVFLEKLQLKVVKKRNQRKRQRDENLEKESGKEKFSWKHSKLTDGPPVEGKCSKQETLDATVPDNDATMAKEADSTTGLDELKMETGTDYDDDDEPGEVIPKDQEMEDPMPSDDALHEAEDDDKVLALENAYDKETIHEKDEIKESADAKRLMMLLQKWMTNLTRTKALMRGLKPRRNTMQPQRRQLLTNYCRCLLPNFLGALNSLKPYLTPSLWQLSLPKQ